MSATKEALVREIDETEAIEAVASGLYDQEWCHSHAHREEAVSMFRLRVREGLVMRQLLMHEHKYGEACAGHHHTLCAWEVEPGG